MSDSFFSYIFLGDYMKKMTMFFILLGLLSLQFKEVITVSSALSLNARVIVIDPGHGGLDNGASYGKTNEDELNLQISFALKEELESRGASVYLTRTDDQDMTKRNYQYSKQDDMYLRARAIDSYQPDVFLSIHLNSANASAWGSQVFYYKNSNEGKNLASMIHSTMIQLTGSKKASMSSDFYILRATKSLGVLIECGFISNANERGQLKSKNYHKKLASVISDGIEKYFNEKNMSGNF